MSLSLGLKPHKMLWVRTSPNPGTVLPRDQKLGVGAGLLFGLLAAATVAIWTRDPLADWAYEAGIFLLAAAGVWHAGTTRRGRGAVWPQAWLHRLCTISLAAIALWGFAQLALGATIYRYATLNAALRMAAFAATALAARLWLADEGRRERFLRLSVVFGAAVAVVGVLAYYTSPGKILWSFAAPYPDVWGVFLSRNNFAQFLELLLPVALWYALRRGAAADSLAAAAMLAAGIASASRAGAVLLIAETVVVFLLARNVAGARPWSFAAAVLALAAVWGGDYLLARFGQPDPLRPQIFASTEAMIADRPGQGTGLGTYPDAYPAYARFDAGRLIDHAHSDWLEWAAEGGVGFAAVWFVFAAGLAPAAINSVWGLGVLAVFLHALVDYPFARFGVAAWVFAWAGALTASGGKLHGENRGARRTYWKEKKVNLRTVQKVLAVAMSVNLGIILAASPVIGTVMTKGSFRVDNATVNGNATLFEGSTLETYDAASSVALSSGAKLWLAASSRGKLYGDRLVLEKGQTQLDQATAFRLEALGLTIQPERATSTGRVSVQGPARVEVAALTGGFRVLNSRGQLVANLAAGSALAFEPQAQASQTRVTGCLESRDGRYVVTDEVTNVAVEVAGAGLADEAGNRVELTGQMDPTATPLSGTSQLIRVSQVRRVARGCGNNGAAAAAAAAGGAAGGAAAAGGISAATIAIVGGVAAGATLGGLAAADALPGQGSSGTPPTASR